MIPFEYQDPESINTSGGKKTKDKNEVSEQLHRAQGGIFSGVVVVSSGNNHPDVNDKEEKD